MRYWVLRGRSVTGPYAVEALRALPGFGAETVVAPENAAGRDGWKSAQSFDELRAIFSAHSFASTKPPPLEALTVTDLVLEPPPPLVDEAAQGSPSDNGSKTMLVIVGTLAAASLAYWFEAGAYKAKSHEGGPAPTSGAAAQKPVEDVSTKSVYLPTTVSSMDDARKCAVGVWTHLPPGFWSKWVIKEGGACEDYFAMPTDDNWGKPTKCEWEIRMDKYIDTGSRFYYISTIAWPEGKKISDVIFIDCQTGRSKGIGELVPVKKGDIFPFSK